MVMKPYKDPSKYEDNCPSCWCPYFICPECGWEICGCNHSNEDCMDNIEYDLNIEGKTLGDRDD